MDEEIEGSLSIISVSRMRTVLTMLYVLMFPCSTKIAVAAQYSNKSVMDPVKSKKPYFLAIK